MELDPVLLARLQFAFVISFHILFPAFTIGLASYIAVLETLWMRTRQERFLRLSQFWTRIFAVSFAMGVVSGIVMSFQFGTNWSRFSDIAGNVIGTLMGYEVLTAFFLEATFLGVLLFGRGRVPDLLHLLASYAVAAGTLMSAFWILSANSWMQTPAGTELIDGRFVVIDWWQAIFNPSFPYRFAHMVTACYLTTAFVVIAVSAWHLRRGSHVGPSSTAITMGLGLVAILAPTQLVIGDLHGLNTFEHQPAKIAAMEGHWETQRGAPLLLFGIPDEAQERNRAEIKIPALGSLILTHEWQGEIRGLKHWPADERPPVAIVFYSFRVMVGIGMLMILVGLIGTLLYWRGRLYDSPRFLRLCTWCLPIGFIALLAGWFTTEIGRQPWVVHGMLRTADATSPMLRGGDVLTSLIAYVVVYCAVFGAGIYYLVRIARRGPVGGELLGGMVGAHRPLAAPTTPLEGED